MTKRDERLRELEEYIFVHLRISVKGAARLLAVSRATVYSLFKFAEVAGGIFVKQKYGRRGRVFLELTPKYLEARGLESNGAKGSKKAA